MGIKNDALASFFLLAFLIAMGWTFLFMCTPVWGNDVWWHLKTGEYIVQEGRFPRTALFPHPYADRPWINLHWLYQVSQYGLYRLGDCSALILCQAFCICLSMVITLFPLLRKKECAWSALAIFLASFILNQRALIRPESYSYVFLALFLSLLESYRREGKKWILVLPLLQMVWTNVQGISILGTGLVGLYWIDEIGEGRRKKCMEWGTLLFFVLVACLAASLINPYGWKGAVHPFLLFGVIQGKSPAWKETITEFSPLWTALGRYHFIPQMAFLAVASLPLFYFLKYRRERMARHVVVYCVFLALSLMAVRNLSLLVLVCLFILARCDALWDRFNRGKACCAALVGIAALSMGWALLAGRYYRYVGDARRFGMHGVDETRYPRKAIEYIQKHLRPGNLFHCLNDGGYLVWHLYPTYKVFIDTRIDPVVMDENHFLDYLRMCEDRLFFEKMATRHMISIVLLRLDCVHQADTFSLVFEGNPRWKVVFHDPEEASLILVLRSERH